MAGEFPTEWVSAEPHAVTREQVSEYIRVTGHTGARNGDELLAPAVFAVLPTQPLVERVLLQALGRPLVELGSVHGEQDINFCRPIAAGMEVYCRARVIGVRRKKTGTVTATQTHMRDDQGRTLNWQYASHFCRDLRWPASVGRAAPQHPRHADGHGLTETVSTDIAPGITVQYANVSNDHSPFHLSDEGARAAGFSGIIVHGLLIMAVAAQAVVETLCAGESRLLRRIAVRFASPLAPGQRITTRIIRDRESRSRYASFDVVDALGNTVLTNGWARSE